MQPPTDAVAKKLTADRQTLMYFFKPQLYIVYNDLELDFAARFLSSTLQQTVKARLKRTEHFNSIYRS